MVIVANVKEHVALGLLELPFLSESGHTCLVGDVCICSLSLAIHLSLLFSGVFWSAFCFVVLTV